MLAPFDPEMDYRRYVDSKSRIAGVLSFLAARGIAIPIGALGDRAEQETAHGLTSRRDHYFVELLAHEGVHVFESAPPLLQDAAGAAWRESDG
jgi:hypothetical protein